MRSLIMDLRFSHKILCTTITKPQKSSPKGRSLRHCDDEIIIKFTMPDHLRQSLTYLTIDIRPLLKPRLKQTDDVLHQILSIPQSDITGVPLTISVIFLIEDLPTTVISRGVPQRIAFHHLR